MESLYEKLISIQANDRKKLIQVINECLYHGKRIKTVLTADHLDDITDVLVCGSDKEVAELHFDLVMHVVAFGMEQIRIKLKRLTYED